MANFYYQYPSPSISVGITPLYFVLDGSNQAVTEDTVNPANTIALPVKVVPLKVLTTRIHDASAVTINNNAGAWVEFGGAVALAANILEIAISFNVGEPLEIGVGPNAGAVTRVAISNQGEGPTKLGCTLLSGQFVWIRSLSTTAVTSGYLTMNLIG